MGDISVGDISVGDIVLTRAQVSSPESPSELDGSAGQVRIALGAAMKRRARETAEAVRDTAQLGRLHKMLLGLEQAEKQILSTCELATAIIGHWVSTGDGATPEQTRELAETGTKAADGIFPIVEVTRAYLAWRDCATAMLLQEAAALNVDRDQIVGIAQVIGASADASLVTMVRQFDAHYHELKNELAEEHAKLSHLAMHDPLTGLVNRQHFLDRLEHSLAAASRTETEVAVFFLDLDSFKAVNDGLGHDAGDRLLQAVAKRLLARVRPGDTVARFGGDEFVILCPELTKPRAADVIRDRLRSGLSEPFTIPEKLTVGVSIGLAMAAPGESAAQIIARADSGMYTAKAEAKAVSAAARR